MSNQDDQITPDYLVQSIKIRTDEVFSTMLGLEIAAIEPQAGIDETREQGSGLVSLIGLAGSWSGTGSISCSEHFACRMASSLLMSPYETLNEDVLDAMGEITNMIIGNVKTCLEERIGPMGLSTPTVIFGRDFQTRSARVHNWTVVPFRSGDEKLFVQMCLAPTREPEKGSTRQAFQIPHVLTV